MFSINAMKKAMLEKFTVLMTAAFGLVAALAWNDTIKAIFAEIWGDQSTVVAMIFYAIIVTIIAVIVTYYIGKAENHVKERLD